MMMFLLNPIMTMKTKIKKKIAYEEIDHLYIRKNVQKY